MNQAFVNGFLKEAQLAGCTVGEAWDIYKYALSTGTFQPPTFSNSPPPNINPPIMGSMKPSSIFTTTGSSPRSTGGLSNGSLGAAGSLSSLSIGPGKSQNVGYNINQTGQGGVNNSVTSAPTRAVNNVLNKPVMPSAPPSM